jgi:hypothetical protein
MTLYKPFVVARAIVKIVPAPACLDHGRTRVHHYRPGSTIINRANYTRLENVIGIGRSIPGDKYLLDPNCIFWIRNFAFWRTDEQHEQFDCWFGAPRSCSSSFVDYSVSARHVERCALFSVRRSGTDAT